MEQRSILISGAGIAGPALAWWLHRYGWRCTVVEQAAELRTAGQNVDIRGAARTVIRRMELDEQVAGRSTGEEGTRFVDDDARTVAAFPVVASDTAGATAEREILRGQLAQLLYDQTGADTEYRFGRRIRSVHERDDAVTVSFEEGADEDFDVVAVAEGVNSPTRGAVFTGQVHPRSLGLTIGYFSVDRTADDDNWWRWYNARGGRTISLRPDNVGRTRANLTFLSDDAQHTELSPDQQKELLTSRFRDVGWQAPRLLDGLAAADDLYLDDLRQIRVDRWSQGRTVLLGDAGYCPTPISGMGTSVALVGAYVLAGELAAHRHHLDAFAAYERVLRPYIEQAQDLPPGTPRLAHPKTAVGIGVMRTMLRLAASPALSAARGRLFSPPADRIELPDYTHLRAVPAPPN